MLFDSENKLDKEAVTLYVLFSVKLSNVNDDGISDKLLYKLLTVWSPTCKVSLTKSLLEFIVKSSILVFIFLTTT